MSPRALRLGLESRQWLCDERRLSVLLLEATFALPARVPPHETASGR